MEGWLLVYSLGIAHIIGLSRPSAFICFIDFAADDERFEAQHDKHNMDPDCTCVPVAHDLTCYSNLSTEVAQSSHDSLSFLSRAQVHGSGRL